MNEERTANENELRERAVKKLEFYVDNCVMYIDTCSLLHFASIDFFDNVEELLLKYSKKINVLSGGVKELEKHSQNAEDLDLASNAKKTLRMLKQFMKSDIIELVEKEGFVDNAFLTLFTNMRMECYPLLITQDKNLANDILNLNNTLSVRANKVRVARINQYGFLSEFSTAENSSEAEKVENNTYNNYSKRILVHPSDRTLIRKSHWIVNEDLRNADEYEFDGFCRYFLIEKIYEVIPEDSEIEYRHVAKLINCLDPVLFKNLNTKTGRILLVTEIDTIFKEATCETIDEKLLHIMIESLVKKRYGLSNNVSILNLTGEQKENLLSIENGICASDLNISTFMYYCRSYFIKKIYEMIPEESEIEFRHVSKLVLCIDPALDRKMNTEMGRVTMVNELISVFMEGTNTRLPREELMKIAKYLGEKANLIQPHW